MPRGRKCTNTINDTRQCSKCGARKPLQEFTIRGGGLRDYECKKCHNMRTKEHGREKRKNDPEQAKRVRHEQYESTKCQILAQSRAYYENHKEAVQKRHAEWRSANPEWQKEYARKRMETDISFRLRHILRVRVAAALRARKTDRRLKTRRTMELIGCRIDELIHHIEFQFKDGMTWENHGNKGWHIDHILPCAIFDLSDPEQQRKCFHYTNLQPLWAVDNMKKGARIVGAHE